MSVGKYKLHWSTTSTTYIANGWSFMLLVFYQMSQKSDGRTNFQNAKFLFGKSQVNINNNKNWKHGTQMRIMHVRRRFSFAARNNVPFSLPLSLSLSITLFTIFLCRSFCKFMLWTLRPYPTYEQRNVYSIPLMLCFVDPIQKNKQRKDKL